MRTLVLGMLVGWAGILVGCAAPTIHPRPAEVMEPGALSVGGYLPFAIGHGRVKGEGTGEKSGKYSFTGITSNVGIQFVATAPPPFWFEVSGRVGVVPRCELGSLLGVFRLGGEARCLLLKEGGFAPASVALSGGAAWLPFFNRDGLWTRAGVDISRHFESIGMVWMSNIYLSQGPESYFNEIVPKKLWNEDELCEDCSDAPSPSIGFVRREVRLATAIGAGWPVEDAHGTFIVGLVPHFVMRADPLNNSVCFACSFEATHYTPHWSVTLTFGYTSFEIPYE